MSDIKLFRLDNGKASAIEGTASHLEKPLQTLIETNLEPLLGIRLVESEHPTGKTHAGRIDTLGLDENHCPVILEYKRSTGENVINQGLFYLDWLMDHKAEFKLLVLERYGKPAADAIDWSAPRLICIAADFTKYDGHAVQQINRNIELIRYRRFGKDLLLLELANAVSASTSDKPVIVPVKKTAKNGPTDKTIAQWLADLPPNIAEIFGELESYLLSLGDDVQRKDLQLYIAFKRLRNFATVVFQNKVIRVYLNLNPDDHPHEGEFTRDVRKVGHWGTGDLEIMINSLADLEKAKPYLDAAYGGKSA
jgi:predicted transport protein